MVQTKKCLKCSETKSTDEFHKNKSKGGYAAWCKPCHRTYDRQHKQNARSKQLFDAANAKRRMRPETRAIEMWRSARKRSLDKGRDFTLTYERVLNAVKHGVCEKTGMLFDLSRTKNTTKNHMCPSLDKIDPKGIYSDENVQVVCWWYNAGKQEMSNSEFEKLILETADHLRKTITQSSLF